MSGNMQEVAQGLLPLFTVGSHCHGKQYSLPAPCCGFLLQPPGPSCILPAQQTEWSSGPMHWILLVFTFSWIFSCFFKHDLLKEIFCSLSNNALLSSWPWPSSTVLFSFSIFISSKVLMVCLLTYCLLAKRCHTQEVEFCEFLFLLNIYPSELIGFAFSSFSVNIFWIHEWMQSRGRQCADEALDHRANVSSQGEWHETLVGAKDGGCDWGARSGGSPTAWARNRRTALGKISEGCESGNPCDSFQECEGEHTIWCSWEHQEKQPCLGSSRPWEGDSSWVQLSLLRRWGLNHYKADWLTIHHPTMYWDPVTRDTKPSQPNLNIRAWHCS